jgi:hypothetical protein
VRADRQPRRPLALRPCRPQAVDELLAQLGADGQQAVPIPSWHYEESEAARQGYSDTRMPLRQALLKCYDLRSPKPELLQLLLAALPSAKAAAAAWADEQETAPEADQIKAGGGAAGGHAAAHAEPAGKGQQAAQKLRALLADAGALDKYLAQRHVVDILQEFAPAALAADKVLPALRQLQPRLYSISSSPLEDAKGAGPGWVDAGAWVAGCRAGWGWLGLRRWACERSAAPASPPQACRPPSPWCATRRCLRSASASAPPTWQSASRWAAGSGWQGPPACLRKHLPGARGAPEGERSRPV